MNLIVDRWMIVLIITDLPHCAVLYLHIVNFWFHLEQRERWFWSVLWEETRLNEGTVFDTTPERLHPVSASVCPFSQFLSLSLFTFFASSIHSPVTWGRWREENEASSCLVAQQQMCFFCFYSRYTETSVFTSEWYVTDVYCLFKWPKHRSTASCSLWGVSSETHLSDLLVFCSRRQGRRILSARNLIISYKWPSEGQRAHHEDTSGQYGGGCLHYYTTTGQHWETAILFSRREIDSTASFEWLVILNEVWAYWTQS